jgi:hypothetical protein
MQCALLRPRTRPTSTLLEHVYQLQRSSSEFWSSSCGTSQLLCLRGSRNTSRLPCNRARLPRQHVTLHTGKRLLLLLLCNRHSNTQPASLSGVRESSPCRGPRTSAHYISRGMHVITSIEWLSTLLAIAVQRLASSRRESNHRTTQVRISIQLSYLLGLATFAISSPSLRHSDTLAACKLRPEQPPRQCTPLVQLYSSDRWNLIPPLPLPVVTCRYRLPPAVRVTVAGRHQVLPRHAGCHRYQP